jgi:hypothetical protein
MSELAETILAAELKCRVEHLRAQKDNRYLIDTALRAIDVALRIDPETLAA